MEEKIIDGFRYRVLYGEEGLVCIGAVNEVHHVQIEGSNRGTAVVTYPPGDDALRISAKKTAEIYGGDKFRAFAREIEKQPTDVTRLVLADFLEESGEEESAYFIRAMVTVLQCGESWHLFRILFPHLEVQFGRTTSVSCRYVPQQDERERTHR